MDKRSWSIGIAALIVLLAGFGIWSWSRPRYQPVVLGEQITATSTETPSEVPTSSPTATPTKAEDDPKATVTPKPTQTPTKQPTPTSTPQPTGLPYSPQTLLMPITAAGFQLKTLTIHIHDTVKWVNNDTAEHQVVADNNAFGSPTLPKGGSFSFTFTKTGTYTYRCAIDPTLQGKINVVAY